MRSITLQKILWNARHLTARQAWNTVLNELEFRFRLPRLLSLPQTVELVLTRACNLRCVFCKDYETAGPGQTSLNNAERIYRQLLPTARRVNICTGGEPHLHPHLLDILRIIRRYRVFTWLLSNGMPPDEPVFRAIVRERLVTQYGFSVDGIERSTVESIRLRADMGKILENVELLSRVKSDEGSQTPEIVIRYALMRSNIEELPAAVHHWGRVGVQVVHGNYVSLSSGMDPSESLFFHQDLAEHCFDAARRAAARYPRLKLVLPPSIREQRSLIARPARCHQPWSFALVDSDGRVLPCYLSWGAITMGNVYETGQASFRSIWNRRDYQALRRTVNDDRCKKRFSYCALCEHRFGFGSRRAHLGDRTWLASLDVPDEEKERLRAVRSRV